MTIQPARRECHACCPPPQAEKPGIQPVVGNTHGTHVEQVASSFQKILRGSQLTWYMHLLSYISYAFIIFYQTFVCDIVGFCGSFVNNFRDKIYIKIMK